MLPSAATAASPAPKARDATSASIWSSNIAITAPRGYGTITAAHRNRSAASCVHGGTIEVEVVAPAARAIEVAKTVTGIGECTVIREAGGIALLSLQGSPDLRPKVVRALVGNAIDVLRIDRGAARLESIFLQLTKSPGKENLQ